MAAVIAELSRTSSIAGCDAVELLPSRDLNGLTALTATRLLMLLTDRQRSGGPRRELTARYPSPLRHAATTALDASSSARRLTTLLLLCARERLQGSH